MKNQSNNYSVQKIIGRRRTRKGQYQYKILWKNWPIQTATWEPLKHLEYVMPMIQNYNDQCNKRNQNRRKKSLKVEKDVIKSKRQTNIQQRKKQKETRIQLKRKKLIKKQKKPRKNRAQKFFRIIKNARRKVNTIRRRRSSKKVNEQTEKIDNQQNKQIENNQLKSQRKTEKKQDIGKQVKIQNKKKRRRVRKVSSEGSQQKKIEHRKKIIKKTRKSNKNNGDSQKTNVERKPRLKLKKRERINKFLIDLTEEVENRIEYKYIQKEALTKRNVDKKIQNVEDSSNKFIQAHESTVQKYIRQKKNNSNQSQSQNIGNQIEKEDENILSKKYSNNDYSSSQQPYPSLSIQKTGRKEREQNNQPKCPQTSRERRRRKRILYSQEGRKNRQLRSNSSKRSFTQIFKYERAKQFGMSIVPKQIMQQPSFKKSRISCRDKPNTNIIQLDYLDENSEIEKMTLKQQLLQRQIDSRVNKQFMLFNLKLQQYQQQQQEQASYKNNLNELQEQDRNQIFYNKMGNKMGIQFVNQNDQKCTIKVNELKKFCPQWLKTFFQSYI